MKPKLLSYITFNNTEDFELWQKANPNVQFYLFTPIIAGLDMSQTSMLDFAAKTMPIKLFVLYGES